MPFDPTKPANNSPNSSAEMRAQLNALKALIDAANALVPIGVAYPWFKSLAGVPALPVPFVECNGQVLSDAESPLDGQTIPDLNGAGLFLRGAATSGTVGGSETHSHTYNSAVMAQAGSDSSVVENGTGTTDASHLPPYCEVVWVMRVK